MRTEAWGAAAGAFSIESDALLRAFEALDKHSFSEAVLALANAQRTATSGCGHSGIACMHLAHLLCCIDRPARFLYPSEAAHGATGFLQAGDVLVLASRGGKTEELLPLERIGRAKGATIIALTEDPQSPLAQGADILLKMHVTRECDRYNCQGTTSFIVLCAIFDALQSALIEQTGYSNEQFALIHPGGAVGSRLNGGESQ